MKKDFTVKIKAPGKQTKTFAAKGCNVKDKSIATKLGLTKHVKETIECDDYEIKTSNEKTRKIKDK